MLQKLYVPASGPSRHELIAAHGDRPAVAATFAPPSPRIMRAAWRAFTDELAASGETDAAGEQFSRVLIRAGLTGWEGIGAGEGEDEAPFTPEAVEVFLGDWRLFGAADRVYVAPIFTAEMEKNVSSPSASGTSEGETRAKPTASTAPQSVRRAPTKSADPKPRKARASGKSSEAPTAS